MALTMNRPTLGSTNWFTAVDDNWAAITAAFLTNATFSGSLSLSIGSVGSPSFYFATDSTSGLYRSGGNEIAFSNAGVQSFLMTSNTVRSNFRMGISATSGAAVFNLVTPTAGSLVTGASQFGFLSAFTGSIDGTGTTRNAAFAAVGWGTGIAVHTIASLEGIFIGAAALGAGSAATRVAGVHTQGQTVGATGNAGWFHGPTTMTHSGTWAFYNGTAENVYLGTGQTSIGSTTDSTSATTGSLITAGGIGVAKALWVGGLINLASTLTQSFTNTTASGILRATLTNPTFTPSGAGAQDVRILEILPTFSGSANNTSGIISVYGRLIVSSTATLTAATNFNALTDVSSATGVITTWTGYYAQVSNGGGGVSAIGTGIGFRAAARAGTGVNAWTAFLHGAVPTGFWGFYNNTADKNYLGTGATLINTTTDDGVSKLQVAGSVSSAAGAITTSQPGYNLTQTWNAGGVTFEAIKANITTTAYSADSRLLALSNTSGRVFDVLHNGVLGINSDTPAFPGATYDAYGLILRTNGSGSAPFDQAGSLIYRTRLSATTGRSSHLFYTGSGPSLRLTIDELGSVILGSAALSTTATDGFLYLPSCAGTPTGAPTAKTGRVPLIVDTTNNKLYFYSGGAWRDAGP